MYSAKMLDDSVSPAGHRLVTMELTFPRFVLAEFNTHRVLSRNSASSRAIPVEKQIAKLLEDPVLPVHWGKNQKGMQADVELNAEEQDRAHEIWLNARDEMIAHARGLLSIGVHKQITNRLLEPWLWHTVIMSGTRLKNFFALRTHKDAQPEFQIVAKMARDLYKASTPTPRTWEGANVDSWHLPLVRGVDLDQLVAEVGTMQEIARISCARCGRVSYLTHEGKRDWREDLAMADRLQTPGHMSPFEHAATVAPPNTPPVLLASNFHSSWIQYRKMLPNEAVFGGGEE